MNTSHPQFVVLKKSFLTWYAAAGTVCTYSKEQGVIQCQVSVGSHQRHEECEIPLCSDLPLCDSQLQNLDQESVPFSEGMAIVSTKYSRFTHCAGTLK